MVAPDVVAHRAEAEAERKLPAALLDALRAAGAFRLQSPSELGGYEASLPTVLDVYEQFGRLDGSVAWNVWNGNLGVVVGLLDPAGVAAVWADSADPVITNSARPGGAAAAVDGGFSLSGRWDMVSAVNSADWITLFGVVMGADGPVMVGPGMPDVRAFFVRAGDVTVLDTWHVGGMRGTGSNTVVADSVFVPDALAPSPFAPARIDRAAFRIPAFTSLSCGSAAICLGMARAAIDTIVELAPTKGTAAGVPLAQLASAQAALAKADAELTAARLLLHSAATQIWDAANAGDEITLALRGPLRAAMCHAARVAREVVTSMYELGSSSSIYVDNRLEQIFRDVNVAAQHGVLNPINYEPSGRLLLGVDPAVALF